MHMKKLQKELCEKYDVECLISSRELKVGILVNVKEGIMPINGLRHSPEGDTSGWYIWSGEKFSNNADFFKPLHIKHLEE